MADFDDDFMDDADDIDFEYEEDGDESGNDEDVDLENTYYGAKALIEDDLDAAMAKFQTVVDNEPEKGKWGFKATKQLVKASFRAGRLSEMLKYYEQMLTYVRDAVTRNESEKAINNLLDLVSSSSTKRTGSSDGSQHATFGSMSLLEKLYATTLSLLQELKNDRLWLKTHLKLAKLYLDNKEYTRLTRVLKQLRASCQTDQGVDDQRKGTQLLEILALEIQMYSETKNNKKLRDLYQQCRAIKLAIPSPRIWGVVSECGGKMYMSEGNWEKAQETFFESFKNYDDAGSPQRIHLLKYLVLASMLSESSIDPFESQETKPYKNDPEIVAMTNLVGAYQRRDINECQRILKNNRATIMDDPFIREYIDEVLRTIRAQVLVSLIQPYARVELAFLANKLNITLDEVEDLLVPLILDGKIHGKLDQILQRLVLTPHPNDDENNDPATGASGKPTDDATAPTSSVRGGVSSTESMYPVMERWSQNLAVLNEKIRDKLNK